MVWRSTKPPVVPPPIKKPERTPDQVMSEMLSAYQHHFYETAKSRPNPTAEEARATIERAKKLISDSRIGYSICALLEHIKYWPFWSQRTDFPEFVGFPARDIVAQKEKTEDHKPKERTVLRFTYSEMHFTLVFLDEGNSSWDVDDMNRYGKAEFYAGDDLVLGVDVSADTSRGFEYERWRFSDAFAFAPGDWMKHLVEIAAHIDAHRDRERSKLLNDSAIEQARKIRL